MYLALRDIRFAKGRFALMGSVVALISLLLVLLSGLTAGLGNQNTAAVGALANDGVTSVAFGVPGNGEATASYTESVVTEQQLQDNLGSLEVVLSDDALTRLTEAGAVDPGFPYAIFSGDVLRWAVNGGSVVRGWRD